MAGGNITAAGVGLFLDRERMINDSSILPSLVLARPAI